MEVAKKIFLSPRMLLLIIFICGSVLALGFKPFAKGVEVSNVLANSSAEINGVKSGIIITAINNAPIENLAQFNEQISKIKPNQTISLDTNKGKIVFVSEEEDGKLLLGFDVKEISRTNLKQGLDLVGGVRVLLKPEESLSKEQIADVIAITQKRLNTFGLQDISVRSVSDFSGGNYILVEMAGATKTEAAKLISQQGKFEAKIGNESVFTGSDIKQVCRSAECAGIRDCSQTQEGWVCQFQFKVEISPNAAKKHAEVTNKLGVIFVSGKSYLDKKLDLYLDNELVDSLYISSDLKGVEATSFVIEGPGTGKTEEQALKVALDNMKAFQTILITGALPVKLELVKIDTISATLGEAFLKSAMFAIFGAILAVGIIIFIRYRNPLIAAAIFLTSTSEIIIILGVAALIHWNLDLPSIAGLIAAIGTGVDAQIVITDELIHGEKISNWREKMKKALAIIFGSFATLVAAMFPLLTFGATTLKGFAIVTIIGASIGVFVTRPAYAVVAENLLKTKEI
ncbi:MAG: site-2 protease family protein [Candidatus Nanoarchaeia archaeon]